MVKNKTEEESKQEEFKNNTDVRHELMDDLEYDYAIFMGSVEEEVTSLILCGFEHYGHDLNFVQGHKESITMIGHSSDRVVYAIDGEELFAIHSETSLGSIGDNKTGFKATIRYWIVYIKEEQ